MAHCKLTLFVQENARLATFKGWPHSSISISAFVRAGFIFKPTPAYPDQCQCFCCHKLFANWKSGDDPCYVHNIVNAQCAFIKSVVSKSKDKMHEASPPIDAAKVADANSASSGCSAAATPKTKMKASPNPAAPKAKSAARSLQQVSKKAKRDSAPLEYVPPFPSPFMPMPNALAMLPYFFQMQQYSAMLQAQAGFQQPMQPLYFDPTVDMASMFSSSMSSTLPGLQPLQLPHFDLMSCSNLSGLNANPMDSMPAQKQE